MMVGGIEADSDFAKITLTAQKAFQAVHHLAHGRGRRRHGGRARQNRAAPSVRKVAPWLATMRALTGTKAAPGSRIVSSFEMPHEIGRRYEFGVNLSVVTMLGDAKGDVRHPKGAARKSL
ncbi:hypothetical protein [Bradyrhizobium liaoningense]|uniref:hypothetical protein n=1 Tax=Bradyrhizobium liaoningense TaxID=43992 RepID=UPI001BABFB9C|nr:hypothetical protein [Bradyrhizobium liaoningense]MBR0904587.1 hypothetical protein [Bradyrhizobium liaoningense]